MLLYCQIAWITMSTGDQWGKLREGVTSRAQQQTEVKGPCYCQSYLAIKAARFLFEFTRLAFHQRKRDVVSNA